jgi:hypothetical protein
LEGPERRVDVMVKRSARYPDTGGWGFASFAAGDREPRAPKRLLPLPRRPEEARLRLQRVPSHPESLRSGDGARPRATGAVTGTVCPRRSRRKNWRH